MKQAVLGAMIALLAFVGGVKFGEMRTRSSAAPASSLATATVYEASRWSAPGARPTADAVTDGERGLRRLLEAHGAHSPLVRRYVADWIAVEGTAALDTLARDPAFIELRLFVSHLSGLLYADLIAERAWLHDLADVDEPSFYYAIASLASFDRPTAERLLASAGVPEADRTALLGYLAGGDAPARIADPEASLAAIINGGATAENLDELSSLFSQLVIQDAASALSLLDQLPYDDRRPAVVADMLASWASVDPESVAYWLMEHPEHAHPDRLHAVAASWVLRDEAAALAHSTRLTGGLKTAFVHALVETIAIVRPESVERWITSNLPRESQEGLTLHAAIRLAGTDPKVALDLFGRVGADYQAAGRAELVSALAHASVSEALRVIDATAAHERAALEQQVMGAIAVRSPDVALERIESWPAGEPRRYVQAVASEAISAWDPDRAIAVIGEIDDPTVQLRAAVNIVNTLTADQLGTVSELLGMEPEALYRMSGSEPAYLGYN